VFLWKYAHFGLVCSDLPPWFFIWFSCWFFVVLNFPANAFGLLFRLNYLCLSCFSNLLACFCKITWNHCFLLTVRMKGILCEWSIEGRKIGLCFIPQNQCLKCHRHWWLEHRPSCRRLCYMWVCFRWKTPGDGNQAPQLYCKQEDH